MSENSKQNDIVTEILDAAFNKDWDDFSPEEYKHQLAETQAEVKKLTPEQQATKMHKRMNLRVQATAIYRKDRHGSRATRKRYFQAFCMPAIILPIPVICKRCQTLHPRTSAEWWSIGSRIKHQAPFRRKFPASVNIANMPAANTKCPKTRN